MSRVRIRDIRNEELIEAAIAATYAEGFASVTMSDIARRAGTTAASINYYFGSKDKLMEAAMRRLLSILRTALLTRLKTAKTPQDRLFAVVGANFDEALFTEAQCSFWMQFWSNAPYVPRLARLHRINRSRVQSHINAELKKLVAPDMRAPLLNAIQAYMDGVWIEAAQKAAPTDPVKAQHNAQQALMALINGARAEKPESDV
ncbi:MAG: transcriptional regulator BetI [Pseudomonadota bacterium]